MTDLEKRLEAMLKPNADGLLPCPNQWCHGIDLIQCEDSAGYRTIECRECGCGSRDTDEMSAIAAWNSRPLVRALVEAAKQRNKAIEAVWIERGDGWVGIQPEQERARDDAAILAILDGEEGT